jgi:Cu-Zn family superoxide dismutase
MKPLFISLPALCLILAACQPADEERPDPESTTDTPALESQSPATGGDPAPSTAQQAPETAPDEGMAAEYAEAEILPTAGQTTGGLIKLTRTNRETRIEGTVTGLEPGAHGFHIHEKGDCSAPDASSAGGHFEPADHPHGSPSDLPEAHHVGDLGNITAGANGEAEVNITDPEIEMSGPNSVIGKAIVVHEGQDDFESQPSGDAGARIGCGQIRALEVAESSTTV